MIVVERMFAVSAAPGPVLAYLMDFANSPQWDVAAQHTTRRDAGPPVPGSTWHHVCKILGVTAELTYALIAVEPGRLVFHGRNEGATIQDTISVRPVPGGSEVSYRIELEMHGLAKLATPVLKVEFEKLGTESVARLAGVLNALAAPAAVVEPAPPPAAEPSPDVTPELHFPPPGRNTAPARSREAQA